MITISGLTRKLPQGKSVLQDIHGQLAPGTFTAVVGTSGSGKSTLLRCLALKEPWAQGEYRFDGKDLIKGGPLVRLKVRRKIAYLEQKPILHEKKTALKNVLIGAIGQVSWLRRMTGMVRNDDYMDAMDTLEAVGLLDSAKKQPVEKMSGGERQRVAVARAIAHGAELLVADEPVSGLDPHSAEEIMAMLKKLCQERGTTVVVALHRLELAEKFADQIWGLDDGRLILDVRGRRLTLAEKMRLS
ncbi:ATP-binding cassette domain-containing protein [Cohnella lubricantis]|uniref:ATP-binding cassette domain-containing protein n=1 Tax=Cohnella lubricantis TaxID=2163172 RepID=A0A841T7Y6_9BACL|nr:ATP-binding cassette domain-containing protein [Cohnella lubricantis]MBB6676166.1 ATP-binding cassette domain-containing protein [Cohnella lubricantis]MBP2118641.1 phosphonate transport system ATP-binding protein [Cohnella lubricantis]